MPKIINYEENKEDLIKSLTRIFQSGNINFLIGSGASSPAIKLAGNIESTVQAHFEAGEDNEAHTELYNFLVEIQQCNSRMKDNIPPPEIAGEADYPARVAGINAVKQNYIRFIAVVEKILNERETNILPKQANVFTTNYDMYFEKASESFPAIKLNDGFTRTPNLSGKHFFSSQTFFNSLFNNGNLYNYKVEIPSINLMKVHGSLTWMKDGENIFFNTKEIDLPVMPIDLEIMKSFNSSFALILPQKAKFRETIMDRTYYDLLRIYANELDKENTLLLAFGFSFADEHVREITKRALKNPTLKLMIFAYDAASTANFSTMFEGHINVEIVTRDLIPLDFAALNDMLDTLPSTKE